VVAARRADGRWGKRNTLPAIKVVKVRGDGCNAVNRMIQTGIHGVELIAGNTDARAMMHWEADVKTLIGDVLTKGLGLGDNAETGHHGAEEPLDDLKETLKDARVVFTIASIGGAGTGAAPLLPQAAAHLGALTAAVVRELLSFERAERRRNSGEAIGRLRGDVSRLIVVANHGLLSVRNQMASLRKDSKPLADYDARYNVTVAGLQHVRPIGVGGNGWARAK
jgi:cell division protein FtsZ